MTELIIDNIFATITNNYYRLTAAEKKVADYVFSHKGETQYMSISELAEASGVAEATVSRFCRGLKLKGYNDFKLSIAKAMAASAEPAAAPVVKPKSSGDDDLSAMCVQLYNAHVAGLTQTMSSLKLDNIKKAADLLDAAAHVYCMGQGGSMLIAQEAEQMFSILGSHYTAVSDSHRQAACAALMSEKDVVLFFSYSGSTKEIVDTIRLVHEQNAKVILVTRFTKSPGGKLADVVLQCGSNEGPLQIGSAAAKIDQLFILDVLFTEMFRRNEETITANQEKIAHALAEKHL